MEAVGLRRDKLRSHWARDYRIWNRERVCLQKEGYLLEGMQCGELNLLRRSLFTDLQMLSERRQGQVVIF